MRYVAIALVWLTTALTANGGDRAAEEFFEAKVRPVLVEKCFSCHGEKKQQSGLRLDSRAAMLQGGDHGAAIVPGDPAKSALVQAIRYDGENKMPPKGKLADDQIATLSEWIRLGAPWPIDTVKAASSIDAGKSHWAFQPVKEPAIPTVKNQTWVANPIDAFVLARLEAKGLQPNPPADKITLIRRLTFDLHGLPPTPAEVDEFVRDESPIALAKLVNRLLASPRYGERWARHWLDLARYADTKGYLFEEERRYPYAYTYRDYVIRAFNEDLPYDRFILEQIAADKLPLGDDKKPLAAMGFLTVGRRFLNNQHDIIDDRLDVIGRGLMGLTISCARCHDHKFDPIPTADYYSLHGVFASSAEPKDLPLIDTPKQTAATQAFEIELAKLEAEAQAFIRPRQDAIVTLTRLGMLAPDPLMAAGAVASKLPPVKDKQLLRTINRADRTKYTALTSKIETFKANSPAAPARAMVMNDLPAPTATHVLLRGNPGSPGPAIPRQFLGILNKHRKPFQNGSGRLEMARAIADPKNPLTARVLVNRVWMHHFGQGLVATPSDFGVRTEPPTHPELLDYLAARFVEEGWSIKSLHSMILLSNTYQQSSADRPDAVAADPENRLLWKCNRQRLDLEALRDSMLATAGQLDLKVGGPSVDLLKEPFVPRRTVYGFIDRQNLPGMFRTFDFAGPDGHAPQRYNTTVPQQALFLMNSPFIAYTAKSLIERSEVAQSGKPEERINQLYRFLFARVPRCEEISLGLDFIREMPADAKPTPWERYAQALLLTNEFSFVD